MQDERDGRIVAAFLVVELDADLKKLRHRDFQLFRFELDFGNRESHSNREGHCSSGKEEEALIATSREASREVSIAEKWFFGSCRMIRLTSGKKNVA